MAHQLFKLIRRDGLAKISYSLVSMNVPGEQPAPASLAESPLTRSFFSAAVLKGVMVRFRSVHHERLNSSGLPLHSNHTSHGHKPSVVSLHLAPHDAPI